ncbi:MAG: Gfo/Idh/MocA family oxidoreductase [Sulfuricurvum sp.]|uniref:Gfo/Idh/MocA family protein n=1 Tax=Sulfuricurvum sp. TaxID=2025608 RepID=UPI0025DFE2E9|nr:Gfo/Idh/MocA family oxidoreductase [Sulfuricurvum sp.]MCK9371613.1 Gfo/Idh/MocA family oxidoreductase [Sulfuricurvum sp.]
MIRCALVGCGNMGGFLDSPEDLHIVTHAHALAAHPDTLLVACCDPDAKQRQRFRERWGETIKPYASLQEMLQHETIDLLIISSPTPFHADALKLALNSPAVHTVICEKPFVETQQELDELLPIIFDGNKRLLINFMRRFDPSIRKAAALLHAKELGELRHFHGTFTKGLYHNGSHMLELIEHLCGPILNLTAIRSETIKDDFYGSFFLETPQCRGTLSNETGDHYALFELTVVLSRGRIRILDSGHTIIIDTLTPSKRYSGYTNLTPTHTLEETMSANTLNTLNFALTEELAPLLSHHLKLSQKLLDIKTALHDHLTLHWSPHV